MSAFGEVVDLTAHIESILKRYPFSIGIFRELLQNSDDAEAKKQVFLLDNRVHRHDSIIEQTLLSLQGPALLAYNDATFSESDWKSLQNINRSSKKINTDKIGKYGIGLRSGYHVTDNLEVLSGDSLVIFDPHRRLIPEGGKKWSLADIHQNYPDQLLPFGHFLPENPSNNFDGTVIRLPLRQAGNGSLISAKVPDIRELEQLMVEFVEKELPIVMLFLSHITRVELIILDDDGTTRVVGKADIERKPSTAQTLSEPVQSTDCTVNVHRLDHAVTQNDSYDWHILHASFSEEDCVKALKERLGVDSEYDVLADLKAEKLCPTSGSPVAIAFPLSHQTSSGRLFTYLPLPLNTGFPCHIHALFALTDSRDHLRNSGEVILERSRDRLLIEWNRVLFQTFIPRAWAALLQSLADRADFTGDIYSAWPPPQHQGYSGESVYWQGLPEQLISTVLQEKLRVWPLKLSEANEEPTVFAEMNEILVAEAAVEAELLQALARARLSIMQSPTYIGDMLKHEQVRWLSPQTAHVELQGHTHAFLPQLDWPSKMSILSYLTSSGDASLLSEIPFVPTVSNGEVALTSTLGASPRTLLAEAETDLFEHYDPDAIALHRLPNGVAEILVTDGVRKLNVRCLDHVRVVEYLHTALLTISMEWLTRFWSWIPSWNNANTLLPSILSMPLLSTSQNQYRTIQDGAFMQLEHREGPLETVLTSLGLIFMSTSFPASALQFLKSSASHTIKDPHDAGDLLDSFNVDAMPRLNDDEATVFREHVASCLSRTEDLTDARKATLRSLPIYCILTPVENRERCGVEHILSAISINATIHCIAGEEPLIVPRVSGVVFVLITDSARLMDHIDYHAARNVLKEADVVELAIEHLSEQSPPLQLDFLRRLSESPTLRSYDTLERLRATRFIAMNASNVYRAPQDLVDPSSALVDLALSGDFWLPSDCRNDTYREMINLLRSIGVLQKQLSAEFVQRRIARVAVAYDNSQDDASRVALRLLQMLEAERSICIELSRDSFSHPAWLPTQQGNRSPTDCRDQRHEELFDRVLPVVRIRIESTALREFLGWHAPISLLTLRDQFNALILEGDKIYELHRVIREFGQRFQEMNEAFVQELRALVSERKWVPISSDPPCIVTTLDVMLSSDVDLPGLHRAPLDLISRVGVKAFLERMGCPQGPSNAAILRQIDMIPRHDAMNSGAVKRIVRLLEALEFKNLTDAEWTRIYLPDVQGDMRNRSELFYDDLGTRALELELPQNRFKIHRQISEVLADHLGVTFLSTMELNILDPDEDDMLEDPVTRVNGVLRSYSIDQAFNEFLANAMDANAKNMTLVLDENTSNLRNADYLSSLMSQFCAGPALIVHNDALFTDKDFKGIRSIGLGGKQDSDGVIGKFGLGALTVFHFTELPMIVSGKYVLFLDPSQAYLPPNGSGKRRALRIPLSTLQRQYPGHLQRLYELLSFSADTDFYNGSLFWLPLRTALQATTSRLWTSELSSNTVKNMMSSYASVAPEALLFNHFDRISAYSTRSKQSDFWSVSAERASVWPVDGDYKCERVSITREGPQRHVSRQEWHVAQARSTLHALPTEFQKLAPKHRMKDLRIGLAGLSRCTPPTPTQDALTHKFFSNLPLPIRTCLPVHIHASFILADDRRSIRFDDNGEAIPEAKYNHYILSQLIPPLYWYLLEAWPGDLDNFDIWPGAARDLVQSEDALSAALCQAFYSGLPNSERRMCQPVIEGDRIQPQDSLFLDKEPSADEVALKSVLLAIKPPTLVIVPRSILKRAEAANAPIQWVDEYKASEVLLQYRVQLIAEFRAKHIDVKDIENTLHYLRRKPDTRLDRLPLLPLADGSLARIDSSQNGPKVFSGLWASSLSVPWPLFVSKHFLHPTVDHKRLLEYDINVSELTASDLADLVQTRLPDSRKSIRQTTEDEGRWIQDFWERFHIFNIEVDEISSLSLVPTTRAGQYVSIDHCRTEVVLASPRDAIDHHHVCNSLEKLGAIVLPAAQKLPRPLLQPLDSVPFTIDAVLKFLQCKSDEAHTGLTALPALFDVFEDNEGNDFAKWARNEVQVRISDIPEDLLPVIRYLPIWPAWRGNTTALCFLQDCDVRIVPHRFRVSDIARVLPPDMSFAEIPLSVLERLSMKATELGAFLSIVHTSLHNLDDSGFSAYERILDGALLLSMGEQVKNELKVPNTSRVLVSPKTLYSRAEPAFIAAFETRQDLFLHPVFERYDRSLRALGLQHERNFTTFKACVVNLDADNEMEGVVDRALVIFEWYGHLPMHIGRDTSKWSELVGYKFIPCDAVRRRYNDASLHPESYVTRLSRLIAPEQILREEHERIAWTQRGQFMLPPDERLLLADLTLGMPTLDEVVRHLRVLALQIAPAHPGHPEVFGDFSATYQWLGHSERAQAAGAILANYEHEPLFLNINTASDKWNFVCARDLIFNAPDEDDRQGVRMLLDPFKPLLLASGALEIQQPIAPQKQHVAADDVMHRFRAAMNMQRNEGQFTDCLLVSSDGTKFTVHRSFLAASNEHFSGMFSSGMRESLPASWNEPIRVELPEEEPVVRCVLDWLYAGDLTVQDTYDQNELLSLLRVSHYMRIADMHRDVQRLLIETLTPGTYRILRENAADFEADLLLKACDEYLESNREVFERNPQLLGPNGDA
ncbi:uncharacterized protein LAESUDRAFT_815637 [Laetiporus sulphureus 93-53]|uniref:BTB domain-containing protein n=1 Tax=Laetiporus sulphureus 93-53 TaxID=1314785 RepID=A0A165BY54_9APHY|nr:uncharacterized protein LAESUDRAFT_815637 [Laetiporus sulphureus 93-53]KZT01862.1 hypothetical protein LAESUDRAFT_815637 [Laetiporus sulphureus 93-53]